MPEPLRLLDLFCCAGGAARGYQRAGFEVVGVDIVPRPNYCGEVFIQMDAIKALDHLIETGEINTYDVIHTSPPCQEKCTLTNGTNKANGWGRAHEQLVPPTRELLDQTGKPYVIEQPVGHGGLIRRDVTLCMDMFPVGPPPWVQRHRDFELGGPWPLIGPAPQHPKGPFRGHKGRVRGMRHGVVYEGPYIAAYGSGGGKPTIAEMQHALGIDWTDVHEELTEAIPPAYTEWIGRQFRRGLADRALLESSVHNEGELIV